MAELREFMLSSPSMPTLKCVCGTRVRYDKGDKEARCPNCLKDLVVAEHKKPKAATPSAPVTATTTLPVFASDPCCNCEAKAGRRCTYVVWKSSHHASWTSGNTKYTKTTYQGVTEFSDHVCEECAEDLKQATKTKLITWIAASNGIGFVLVLILFLAGVPSAFPTTWDAAARNVLGYGLALSPLLANILGTALPLVEWMPYVKNPFAGVALYANWQQRSQDGFVDGFPGAKVDFSREFGLH